MASAYNKSVHRNRELRRRVVLPARLRTGAQWSDTCILNISSRGLLIHSARHAAESSLVELRRGDHVILARVMWRDGARVGLQSEDRLRIEQILSLSHSKTLQLVASDGLLIDRRRSPRVSPSDARLRGRTIQFLGVAAVAVTLSLGAWATVEAAFARPLALVAVALGDQSFGTCSR